MIKVYAKTSLGVTVEMQFESLSKARRVFQQAGYGTGVCVKDDTGIAHININTLDGFSQNVGNQEGGEV